METFFLASFAFGAVFAVASWLLGAAGHLPGVHLPGHGPAPNGGAPHLLHGGGVHLAHPDLHVAPAHSLSVSDETPAAAPHASVGLPLLNASSALAFLTWFGAAGYLGTRFGGWPAPLAVVVAIMAGLVAWVVIAAFLRLLLSGEREMDPWDYRLEGTVARVTVAIPAGGTGEVVFAKAGARRSEGARAKDGAALEHGREVVIVNYSHGIATVEPWESFVGDRVEAPALETRGTDAPPATGERSTRD